MPRTRGARRNNGCIPFSEEHDLVVRDFYVFLPPIMIAFIDTEVDPQTKKVTDYGAVREDGAVLHAHSKADFDAFVSKCDTICGHNIINHDLKYTALRGNRQSNDY